MRPINRIMPNAPAQAYKTYAISSPIQTHFRPGTCEEAGCPNLAAGFVVRVDERLELGQRQAYYIRKQSGRRFTESRDETGLTAFTFPAGQQCFTQHQISLQRPENFLVRGGDWRGNPLATPTLRHSRPEFWVEDFAEHQDRIATARVRG